MSKVLYFDLETTGLDPKLNGVIQLAGIIEVDGKEVDEFDIKMQPFKDDKISPEALAVNGVTLADIEQYKSAKDAHQEFINILGRHVDKFGRNDKYYPAGYNVSFDINFLGEWFRKNGDKYLGSWWNWRYLDPRPYFHALNFQGKLDVENMKLETICKHYGIHIEAHDALSDIRATRELIQMMLSSAA